MERLTIRDDTGQAYPVRDCDNCQEYLPGEQYSHECLADLVECLAAYEDLEEQGLLLRLPCKIEEPITAFGQTLKKEELLNLLYLFLG